ncbi:MAG: Crp/Fnr family transcriptional regulator [Bacillota bacterium]|jgi:CRP-like cAMP-binding protein
MKISDILKTFQTSVLFEGLSDAEIHLIYKAVRPSFQHYKKNSIIYNEGDIINAMGIIVSGEAAYTKYEISGKSYIIDVWSANEILCPEIATGKHKNMPVAVVALNDCSIVFFSYEAMMNTGLIDSSVKMRIMQNLICYMDNVTVRKMYKMEVLSKYSLRDRILTYLMILEKKSCEKNSESDKLFNIKMTQEQFARNLFVSRSALSSELNKMRREGLIDFQGRMFVLNKDRIYKYGMAKSS